MSDTTLFDIKEKLDILVKASFGVPSTSDKKEWSDEFVERFNKGVKGSDILLEEIPENPDFTDITKIRQASDLGLQIEDFVGYSIDNSSIANCSIVDDNTGVVRRIQGLKLDRCDGIGTNNYSIDREEDIIRTFISHRADGLILTGHTHTAYSEELIKSFAIPTVEIWNLRKGRDFVCVGMSNYRAAYEMTEYLIKKGYKRIGYIGGLLANNDRSEDRLNGYRDALKNYGVEFDTSIIRESEFSLVNGAEAMRSLLTLTHRPDCVFASSDIIAFGALIECQNKGISIPDDIALAGFDDAVIGSMTKPGLTTVRVPRRQIGLKAGNVIMKLLQKDPDISSVNDLGFDLAIRDTA